jgi:hypothetical protein
VMRVCLACECVEGRIKKEGRAEARPANGNQKLKTENLEFFTSRLWL